MRGLNLACSPYETLPSRSPQWLFAHYGSVLQRTSAYPTARSYRLETAFRSPTATALFREPPQWGQCSWPISSALIPALSNCPFGLELPPSPPCFSALRGRSMPKTRCRLPAPELPGVFWLPLPFGTFIPPDRSAQPVAEPRTLTVTLGPISLRSPPTRTSLLILR